MRYVIVLCSLFVVGGCATQKSSQTVAGGDKPSEIMPNAVHEKAATMRETPEDRSRFDQPGLVGENRVP